MVSASKIRVKSVHNGYVFVCVLIAVIIMCVSIRKSEEKKLLCEHALSDSDICHFSIIHAEPAADWK